MKVKELIKQSFFFSLYKRLHIGERVQLYKDRKKMEEFANKGDSVIKHVHKVLNQSGHLFFVDAGTLIGIYRDGHLLKRDMDVDMGIIVNSQDDILMIRKLLTDNAFELKICFKTPSNGIIQDAFDYDGIRVDMCYFIQETDATACYILYGDKILKMTFCKICKTRLFTYEKQEVSIPDDSEKYLEERYGMSWKVPDPYFKYWEGPCVTPVDGHGITEFF